jgi:hypothetical protein
MSIVEGRYRHIKGVLEKCKSFLIPFGQKFEYEEIAESPVKKCLKFGGVDRLSTKGQCQLSPSAEEQ